LCIGLPSLPHWYIADHGAWVLLTFPGQAQLGLQQSSMVVVENDPQLEACAAVCTVGSGFGLFPALGRQPVTWVRAMGHSTWRAFTFQLS
jgi:hypothetical protein